MEVRDQNLLPPVIIGIAGGSGSGKTTVAQRVCDASPGRTIGIINHDAYYLDNAHLPEAERAAVNYDHPNAFETGLLVEHLRRLRRGESVAVPQYDYATHCRREQTRRVEPADIIFVEGILVLENAQLRELMDIRLYVDVDADERLIRRLRRDTHERGRSVESVLEQYLRVVRPMHLQFCAPSKRHAHVIIPEGGHNQVAIDLIATKIADIAQRRRAARFAAAGDRTDAREGRRLSGGGGT
jgi:uridine kinase